MKKLVKIRVFNSCELSAELTVTLALVSEEQKPEDGNQGVMQQGPVPQGGPETFLLPI